MAKRSKYIGEHLCFLLQWFQNMLVITSVFVLMKCLLLVTFVSHQPVFCLFLILFFYADVYVCVYVYLYTYIFQPDFYDRKTPSYEDFFLSVLFLRY